MKPYNKLTKLGRLRRLRQLARVALAAYGLNERHLTFLHYEGNLVYRVDTADPRLEEQERGPYLKNRYILRVLSTPDMEATASELTWLEALSREASLPVPQPVPTLDGELLIRVFTPGVPQGRIVSVMRWLDGRRLTKGFRSQHFRAWGQMMARLHLFSETWQPPEGFNRPHWDWYGQLGGRDFDYSVEDLVDSMPKRFQDPFERVSKQARQVMQDLGKEPDAYGLIHSDMYPENVLFKGKEVFPIDFEDCGFGYWMWDIGVALCQWPWTEDWYWMRDSFLEGYTLVRTLPASQLAQLDLFMAAQYATMVLWASAFLKHDPARKAEHEAWRNKEGIKLLRYFERQ